MILGFVVLAMLTDWPHQARWLTDEERAALQAELLREKEEHKSHAGHMTVFQALAHPKVLALAAAYFFVVTGNYGVELYMASILKDWYSLNVSEVAYLIIIPPVGSLLGQVFIGWNSDRTHERRWHASLPIIFGAIALAFTPATRGTLWLTVVLFTLAMTGVKAYLPAFWTLPSPAHGGGGGRGKHRPDQFLRKSRRLRLARPWSAWSASTRVRTAPGSGSWPPRWSSRR